MHKSKRRRIHHGVFSILTALLLQAGVSLPAFSQEVHQFDIDTTDAAAAIHEFGNQSGVQILASGEVLRGKRLNRISGELSTDVGFQQLLAGTGLSHRYVGERAVAVVPEPAAAEAATAAVPAVPEGVRAPESGVAGSSTVRPAGRPGFWERIRLAQIDSASRSAAARSAQALKEAEGNAKIEEVTVTARRSEEALMKTPVSITAFTAEDLTLRQVERTNQIAESVPNLVFRTRYEGLNNAAIVYIRGIGQSDFMPTVQAGVGTYVDGVYISSISGALMDTADMASIEVLRGPQGTLFGRNTIGGAILVNSVKPNDTFSGQAELTLGDYARREIKGSINVPFTDTFYGRLSVLAREKDGFVKTPNIAGDRGLGSDETKAVRLALRWVPTDTLTFDLVGDFSHRKNSGPPSVLTGISTAPGTLSTFYNTLVVPALNLPSYTAAQFVPSGETYTNLTDYSRLGDADIWGLNLTAEWQLGAVTLKSITSYRDQKSFDGFDADLSPVPFMQREDSLVGDQTTQEFQLSGKGLNERLKYVAGLYYFQEDMVNLNNVQFNLPFPGFAEFLSGGIVDNKSSAIYGQLTYDLTDRWSVTGGYRYSEDRLRDIVDDRIQYVIRTFNPAAPGGYTVYPAPPAPGALLIVPQGVKKSDYDGAVPYLNVTHTWDDFLAYVSFSKGYKGGGFSQRVTLPNFIIPFGPEKASVYELGFKWTGFDQRLRLTGAIFDTDYEDLQVSVICQGSAGCIGTQVVNASNAVIKGGELELQAALTPRLRISMGLGYLTGEYKNAAANLSFSADNDLPSVPKWQRSASVTYHIPLPGDFGQLLTRVDYTFNDSYFLDGANQSEVLSYSLYNAGVTYVSAARNWELGVQARNLADKYYWLGGAPPTNITGIGTHSLGAPREVSARFVYRF